jgi:hypothetical protein
MAIRSITLTTAAGMALAFALQADAEQASVSLATGSAAPAASTASVKDAATTAAATATLAVVQTPAPAPDEPPTVTGGVNVDMFSHYVWRGFALTDGFAFQPSVWVKTHDITFTSWSSWSSTDAGCFDPDDCPALREHDFTIDYTKGVGKATLSVGYINYLFPPYRTDDAKAAGAIGATNEFYVGAAFTAPLNPFVKAYFDVDAEDGTYLQFGVSHPISLAEGKATLTPSFAIAYNFKQWIPDNDWNDANLGAKLTIPINDKFSISPSAYLSIGLNDTVKLIGYGDGDTKFYGGVGFSYTF